jgi:hypothetical protein
VAYLGVQPTAGQYRKLDDISGSFNGSTTTFTTQVGGQNVTAGSAQSILVSLGGVIQSPGTNYSVSTNSITFVTAPAAGLSFFAILLGEAVNTGTPSDGTVTPAKLSTGGPSWNSTGNVVLQTAGTTAAPALQTTGDTNTGIYFPAADTIGFVEGGAESARFDSNGRFLVGTSTTVGANRTLQVAGTGAEFFYNAADTDAVPLILSKSRGSLGSPTIVSSGDNTGFIRFRGYDGSGYVDTARIESVVDGTPGTNDMPGRLAFYTTADGASSPSERMRISSTGQVSVTVGATVGFRVDSSTSAESVIITGSGSNLQIRHPAAGVELFNSSGTAIRVIANTGGVSLANGATAWAAISDERLKTDLIDIEDGLNKTASLRAVTGRYIADESETRRSFLIAQDVEAVLPEAVESSNPDELGLRYTEVIPLLVAALKEAKERIETLEAKVAALKGA